MADISALFAAKDARIAELEAEVERLNAGMREMERSNLANIEACRPTP